MSKRADKELVADILESINRIEIYVKDMNYEQFIDDIKTQDSVVRNIEILGEAAKSISESFKNSYSDLPWKEMAGVRDKLIHDYFGVNYDIVWDIIKNELPVLKSKIGAAK